MSYNQQAITNYEIFAVNWARLALVAIAIWLWWAWGEGVGNEGKVDDELGRTLDR